MNRIGANTRLYGIIGSPVRHSLSPIMHNAAFRALEMDAVYLAFETKDTKTALDGMRCLGICGYSVTIPNKESIIEYLDEADDTVKEIGACNTVKNSDGSLVGINTDWLGSVIPIENRLGSLKGLRSLVIGAGGSSRAICYGLLKRGARVTVCNRTIQRAKALSRDLGCSWCSLEEASGQKGDILINATSVGMGKDQDKTPVDKEVIKNFSLVMDIIYWPVKTKFLKIGDSLGKITINGLEMLLHQAVAQFKFWTGENPPIEVMKEALKEYGFQ